MNATRSMKWGLAASAAVFAALAMTPGCELLVQFDRTLIDGGTDGTLSDSMPPGDDGPTSDAPNGQMEAAGDDGGADAPVDTAADVTVEAQVEAAGGEGKPDAPGDAPIAPADAPVDAFMDAPAEVGDDSAADAPAEVGDDGSTDAAEGGDDSAATGDDSG
jgi:hypothetical protein